MSKLSKKNRHLANEESEQQQYPGPSFEDNLDFFYDILCTPIRTRSKEQCESIACAIQQTKFYKFYEKELQNRQDILHEMAQSMGCECIRMCCKIFDEGQIAKKVYIIMDGEVCILSNLINRETARIPPPPKNVKSAGKKEHGAQGTNQVEIKKKNKFTPKNFETKYPLQEEFMSLKTSEFFGDIDLRYNAPNSLSAVTRKNTNCATIPADVFLKFFSEKTKVQEEVQMLKKCDIFKFIPNQFVEYILRFGTEIKMHIGSSVYKEGDVANDVYFIKDGEIEFSMSPSQQIEEERKKLKEIKAKFGENGQQEDGFDEIKFERSSLFHKVLYEKGHSEIKAKQLWSCDDLLKKEISCLSDSKDQSFQEKGLKVFSQDNKEFSLNKEETAVMTSALSQKMINAEYISYFPSKFQRVEGLLELNETINGYKLYTLAGGQCFGDEELLREQASQLIDPVKSFVPEVLKVLKSINSALLPENYELNKKDKPSNRLMGAQCKSAHCGLLKISYKLFMSFVCLANKELQLHTTLMESSIKAWRKDKILKHVQQMKEASKSFRSLNIATPIRTYTPCTTPGKIDDHNLFGNASNPEKTKPFFGQHVLLKQPHSASGFYKNKCQSEKNILSSSQGLSSLMKVTVDSPEKLKNRKVNQEITVTSFKDDISRKSSNFSNKNITKELRLSLLDKVHIPLKKGFKVTLEQEDITAIHSPRNTDQKQITSPQQLKPSKFSNLLSNFASMAQESDISGQKQAQMSMINTTTNVNQANQSQNKDSKFISFGNYLARRSSSHRLEMTQIPSKPAITTPTTSLRSVGTSLNSPSSAAKIQSKKLLNFTQSNEQEQQPENKSLPTEQQLSKNNFFPQKSQSKMHYPNGTSSSLNCSISFINFGENRFVSQRNLKSSSEKKEKEESYSSKTLAELNSQQQYQLSQNNTETNQDSSLKIQRKCSSIFPVKSSHGMIHSSSKNNFHDLIGQIGKHDKPSDSNKNEKPQQVRLEIFHDFINKKYRKAFNEAQTKGQIQLKPQSFLIFGKEGEHQNSQTNGETLLQLQKKHEIEKKFPMSPAAEKINSYFNNKIQSINKQHKESLQRIKINNKHSNIKLFCDDLTKKVIEQEEKERKELEEASLFFNFTLGGRTPEK